MGWCLALDLCQYFIVVERRRRRSDIVGGSDVGEYSLR